MLWDLAQGKKRALMSHSHFAKSVAFSPDGKTLASAGNDSTVKLWKTYDENTTSKGFHKPVIRIAAEISK